MSSSQKAGTRTNRLLAALPDEVYQRLTPYLEFVPLTLRQVIYEIDEPITQVYFPHHALISLVTPMEDGSTIEVGMVGQEGIAGISAVLSGRTQSHYASVQSPGSGMRLNASVLKAEFERGGALQRLMLKYFQAVLAQATQCIACNRFHTTEERLARWLLLVHNSLQTDEFQLTQEFMGQMLGIRRSSVTVAVGNLSQARLIRYRRGSIKISNREALEDFSCECYGVIQREYAQLSYSI